jgi:hypothetical protein
VPGASIDELRASSKSRALELLQECPRRRDRQLVAEREHVCVSRNERCALARGERKQIIVAGVIRMNGRRSFGVGHNLAKLLEQSDEPSRVFRRHPTADLGSVQRSLHLVEQCPAHDELDITFDPELDESRRRPDSRDQSRNEDVGVDDRPHALGAATFVAAALVLRLRRDP